MKRHPCLLVAATVVATLAAVHTTGLRRDAFGAVAGRRRGVRRARRARQVLRLPLGWPERLGVRRRHPVGPPDPRDSGVRAAGGVRLRDERERSPPAGARRDRRRVGRHAPPDPLGNQRHAGRQVSLDQRSRQRPAGAHPSRLLRSRSHPQDPEPAGGARHRRRLAEHEVHRRQRRVRAADRRPGDEPGAVTSVVAFVDPDSMEVKFQVRVNGNIDIADTSKDGRYSFSTVYNLEQGKDMGSMIQYDRDAVAAIDIAAAEKAVAAGRGQVRNGVPILDPAENPGLLTLIPVPKNPHGINVTPDGRYAIAAGKLSPTVTIIDAHTLKIVAEPEVGLGPLHTTFDDRGNAFTSLFLDSQVVKWNIDKAVKGASDYIVDRINVHYNIGHLQAVGGDHMNPAGDYLIALNKLSKDMYVPVGPDLPENQEIIDISGEKMKLLASFPTPPEPHDATFMAVVGAEAARPPDLHAGGRRG